MGFNKKYVRPLEDVKKEFEELGEEDFIFRYRKVDSFIGPADSIDFINQVFKNYQNSKKESSIKNKNN